MKLAKILLPTDFSAHSYEGLRIAEVLAHQADAELLIVHVIDTSQGHGEWPTTDDARHHVEQLLCATRPACTDVRVTHALLEGATAAEVVRYAKHEDVDLIVIGSHGRSGLSRVLMGSVASSISAESPCPVLSVRPRVRLRGETKAWAHRKPHTLESHSTRSPSSN